MIEDPSQQEHTVWFHGLEMTDREFFDHVVSERAEMELLTELLEPSDRVYIAGVGMGISLTAAACLVGPSRVVGYEADPLLAQIARDELKVDCVPLAVGSAAVASDPSNVTLQRVAAHWGRNSTTEVVDEVWDSEVVPAVGLARSLWIHQSTVLVMDVEGMEYELLPDERLEDTLVRAIVLEEHPYVSENPAGGAFLAQSIAERGSWEITAEHEHGRVGDIKLWTLQRDVNPKGVLETRREQVERAEEEIESE